VAPELVCVEWFRFHPRILAEAYKKRKSKVGQKPVLKSSFLELLLFFKSFLPFQLRFYSAD
jgi:hypothetical protein